MRSHASHYVHVRMPGLCSRRTRIRPVAVRCFETVRDTEETPPELDEQTIRELMDLGMSRDEAEAEAAWDPTEADPQATDGLNFDNLYSVDDALPDDVREELTRKGYGPPVCPSIAESVSIAPCSGCESSADSAKSCTTQAIIAAGFRLEEYAMLRYLLDGIDASHVKVLVADEQLLYSTLDDALATPEINWEEPRPENWIKGGGWGSSRVCLFSGLSVAQQV